MASSNPYDASPAPKRQKLSTSSPPPPTQHPPPDKDIKMADRPTQLSIATSDNGFQWDREGQVGVTQFVNNANHGFSGVLKQRYIDFQVNEILPDGTVAHLTNDRAPKDKPVPKPNPEDDVLEEQALIGKQASTAKTLEVTDENIKPSANDQLESSPRLVRVLANTASSKPSDNVKLDPEPVEGEPGRMDDPKRTVDISPQDDELLAKYFGPALKDEIIRLYLNILSKPTAKPATFGSLLTEPISDRGLRSSMHGDIRRIFEGRLETEAIKDTGAIKISAAPKGNASSQYGRGGQNPQYPRNQQNNDGQTKGKLGWAELGGQYLHFSLYKENKDTMEVVSYLARVLKVKVRDFAFAGTKDRRAATVQRVSVLRQHAKRLAGLNRDLRNARIGNFSYEKYPLELGELQGNQFQITLRDCHFGDDTNLDEAARVQKANEIVGQAVKHLQEKGFINYFGLQRFGTFGIGTDEIGKQILQGNFEGAVNSILTFSEDALACALNPNHNPTEERISRDDIARAHAIHLFKTTGKSGQSLDILPRKFSAEGNVIRHLGNPRTANDHLGALNMINRSLKTMYVHAYQSLVWNMVASKRWARHGAKVVQGDLVIVDTQAAKDAEKDEVDENGEIVVHPAGDDVAVTHDDLYQRARPLTREDADSGKYTIFDIVLPTPGFDIEYPGNDIGDYYKEFMGSDRGGGLDPANMRRSQKDFSLSGSYRKLIAKPMGDLSFEIKTYHDELEQLVETDLEKLDKSKPNHQNNANNHANNPANNNAHQNGRGNYQQNNRGAANNRRGGRGNRFQPADTRSEAEKNKAMYAGTAQGNAWLNLPAKLAAEDKAAAAAAELEKKANMFADPKSFLRPEIKDTWIQTDAEKEGRRTGVKSTVVHAGSGDQADNEEAAQGDPSTPAPPSPVTDVVSEKPEDMNPNSADAVMEIDGKKAVEVKSALVESVMEVDSEGPAEVQSAPTASWEKRVASMTSTSGSSDGGVVVVSAEAPKVEVVESVTKEGPTADKQPTVKEESVPNKGPTRIAVIVKFCLGSSQYATMALRELMKSGGVKTYKPDFSRGR